MAKFSDDKIQTVWENAQVVEGSDPITWRQDPCGAFIDRDEYRNKTQYGWEIDHIFPEAKGGTDRVENLCAMHWRNNESKADSFPVFQTAVTFKEFENVEHIEDRKWDELVIKRLKSIYPNIQI